MASNDVSESKMTTMDLAMVLTLRKMIPCPGVGILKIVPCSAARPRTEKYMSSPPPPQVGLYSSFSCMFSFALTSLGKIVTYRGTR